MFNFIGHPMVLFTNATLTLPSWTEELAGLIANFLIFVDPSRHTWLSIGLSGARIRTGVATWSNISWSALREDLILFYALVIFFMSSLYSNGVLLSNSSIFSCVHCEGETRLSTVASRNYPSTVWHYSFHSSPSNPSTRSSKLPAM